MSYGRSGTFSPDRRWIFDSVDEFMGHAYDDKAKAPGNEDHRRINNSGENGGAWWGMHEGATSKDIRKTVRDGWLQGTAMVYDRMGQLEVPWVPSVRRRLRWTDQGDHLDMPRVYAGQLDVAWQKGIRAPGQGPQAIRIVVDNCYDGNRIPEQVQWRGIAAIAMAEGLIDAGHNVELVSAFRTSHRGEAYVVAVTTKGAMMPLDVSMVAATTAFSGFFRNTCLQFLWTVYARPDSGCGLCESLDLADLDFADVNQTYLVPQGTDSQEDAQAWVTKAVNRFKEGAL